MSKRTVTRKPNKVFKNDKTFHDHVSKNIYKNLLVHVLKGNPFMEPHLNDKVSQICTSGNTILQYNKRFSKPCYMLHTHYVMYSLDNKVEEKL